MVEYAIVSGQNFINLMGPTLAPLTKLYKKVGLNLSAVETAFATLILAAFIILSLYFLATKR